MKEEKIGVYVKDLGNPPCSDCQKAPQTLAPLRFHFLKNETPFGLPSAAYLLNWILSCLCHAIIITNRTVSNKYINILGIV